MAGKKAKKPELSPEEKQKKLNSDLHAGLYHGKLEDMRALIEQGAQVNSPLPGFAAEDENESEEKRKRREATGHVAPIHISAQAGRPDLVALFIEHDADVNNPKFKGSGPLHYAAASGKPEAGVILLEAGADPNHVDHEGTTPLMDCIRSGNKELFYTLLPLTRNLDQQENKGPWYSRHEKPEYTGDTALLRAASRGWVDEVKALHEHGADLTLAGTQQRNILHVAAAMKEPDVIRYVLKHAPELANQGEYRGGLPLHKAIMMGADDCVDLLLPVTTALEASEKAEHAKQGDESGDTVLHAAIKRGRLDWVKALLEKGAKIDATGIGGRTAMHNAVIGPNHNPELAAYILKTAPDLINARDDEGKTPLMRAAAFGPPQALETLAQLGVNLNETGPDEFSAMHIAVSSNRGDNVALLTKYGASLYKPEIKGARPIDFATNGDKRAELTTIFNFIRSEQTKQVTSQMRRQKNKQRNKKGPSP